MKWFARKTPPAPLAGEVVPETISRRVEITVEREVRWTVHREHCTQQDGPSHSSPAACPVCGQALPATGNTDISTH